MAAEQQKRSLIPSFGKRPMAGSGKIINTCDGQATALVIESSLLVTLLASKFRRSGAHIQ
jgi:hypothetical protein